MTDPDDCRDSIVCGDRPDPRDPRDMLDEDDSWMHERMRRDAAIVSRMRIRTMMQEAAANGKTSMVRLCEEALEGDQEALVLCGRALAGADEAAEDGHEQ